MTSHHDDVKILIHHRRKNFNVYNNYSSNRAVNYSVVLKVSLSMRKIEGSIPRPVKSDIV